MNGLTKKTISRSYTFFLVLVRYGVKSPDLGILKPCDSFGPYLGKPGGNGVAISISGLDIALAYLRADGIDVMGYPYPTPDRRSRFPFRGNGSVRTATSTTPKASFLPDDDGGTAPAGDKHGWLISVALVFGVAAGRVWDRRADRGAVPDHRPGLDLPRVRLRHPVRLFQAHRGHRLVDGRSVA